MQDPLQKAKNQVARADKDYNTCRKLCRELGAAAQAESILKNLDDFAKELATVQEDFWKKIREGENSENSYDPEAEKYMEIKERMTAQNSGAQSFMRGLLAAAKAKAKEKAGAAAKAAGLQPSK